MTNSELQAIAEKEYPMPENRIRDLLTNWASYFVTRDHGVPSKWLSEWLQYPEGKELLSMLATPAAASMKNVKELPEVMALDVAINNLVHGNPMEPKTIQRLFWDIINPINSLLHATPSPMPAKEDWEQLVKAMDDYIEFLDKESHPFISFCYTHGVNVSDRVVKEGQQHREKISLLKMETSPPASQPLTKE